jgi:recombination protein RecR
VKDELGLCRLCKIIADSELCQYCRDPNRNRKVVCVVEEPANIVGIEATCGFDGWYDVLHGSLSLLRCRGSGAYRRLSGHNAP